MENNKENIAREDIKVENKYICKKCGTVLDSNSKFCPKCGEKKEIKEEIDFKCKKCGAELSQGAKFCNSCGAPRENKEITEGIAQEITEEDIRANKNISIFCYLGVLMLIPILKNPNSNFVKYHANQGFILLLLVDISTLNLIISRASIGKILGLAGMILSLVLAIIGIINVVNGKVKPLPIIGKYSLLK